MRRTIIACCCLWSVTCFAADDSKQRLLGEACTLVSQQRNSLADALAVSEAQKKIADEDAAKLKQWVKDYFGEAK